MLLDGIVMDMGAQVAPQPAVQGSRTASNISIGLVGRQFISLAQYLRQSPALHVTMSFSQDDARAFKDVWTCF